MLLFVVLLAAGCDVPPPWASKGAMSAQGGVCAARPARSSNGITVRIARGQCSSVDREQFVFVETGDREDPPQRW